MRTDIRTAALAALLGMAALPQPVVPRPAGAESLAAIGPALAPAHAPARRATTPTPSQPARSKPAVLIDTFNTGGTVNGPRQAAVFTIRQAHRITLVQTYHWNGGRGARPGTIIFVRTDGRELGPWPCTGSSGQGGVPSFWTCVPDVEIPPDRYEVRVSSPETWSHNPASGGRGFVRVEGTPSDLPRAPAPAPAPAPRAAVTLRVERARTPQTVSLDDRLSITVPASLSITGQEITVAEVPREQQLIGDGDLFFVPINAFSVSMGRQRQFKDEITLSFRYDPADLNPKYPAAQQIVAHHWDEARQVWLPMPSTVDTASRTVHVRTRHLSLFSCSVTAAGLAKLAAIAAGAAAAVYVGHHAYEKVWLDNYRSPNFLIYYADGDVNGNASPVRDSTWWPTGRTTQTYQAGAPRYVQDLARFLEEALRQYQAAGFVPPPTPVTVKINSALIKHQANPGGYEHWYGRIHVNTAMARHPDRVKQITAHELFHAVQSGDRTVAAWWQESTAEYASCQVAWPLSSLMGGGSTADIDPKLLSVPMPHTGVVSSGLGEIEYDKGYFVAHLVARGANFAGLWRVVAGSSGDTRGELVPIERHLAASGAASLGRLYRDFVGSFLFSQGSPIGSSDPSRTSIDRAVSLPLPAKPGQPVPPIAVEYNLPAGLTTRLIAVTTKVAPAQPKARSIIIGLSAKTSDTHADVYLLTGNAKPSGKVAPAAVLEKAGDSATLDLGASDVAYIALTNTSLTDDGHARITVGDFAVQLSISPSVVTDLRGKLDHAFTATGKPIPPGVRLSYRWDFGDHSPAETGSCQGPTAGAVTFAGAHKYAKVGKYTVVAQLFDVTSGSPKPVASASARVEILEAASQPPAAGAPVGSHATHLKAIRPAGDDRTTIVCDLAGSTQYFVTKKMLNYPDPPFEIGLHDKGTTTIDSTHKDFGPAEYKLYKVTPPKTYLDYLMNRTIAVTLVETVVVR